MSTTKYFFTNGKDPRTATMKMNAALRSRRRSSARCSTKLIRASSELAGSAVPFETSSTELRGGSGIFSVDKRCCPGPGYGFFLSTGGTGGGVILLGRGAPAGRSPGKCGGGGGGPPLERFGSRSSSLRI